MDEQVLTVQKWLNGTYSQVAGWVRLEEDGRTGWETIFGLRRALQTELGITPTSSGFGDKTRSMYLTKVGNLDENSRIGEYFIRILSGALWCKGYPGVLAGTSYEFRNLKASVEMVRTDLDIATGHPFVDVKLMASLLSMDSYTIPSLPWATGRPEIRDVQRWLNRTYSHRRDFSLVPCDGIPSRQIQSALLYALQYEFGMADGVANGNFGPGTRAGLRDKAQVGEGSADGASHFVRLFQAALRLNRRDTAFTGTFDAATRQTVSSFQSFMEIPQTGRGDYTTWCSLIASNGDTSVKTRGLDTSRQLTEAMARDVRAAGYTHVGRYTVGADKFITASEMDALKAAGLLLFPLHQRFNNSTATMTAEAGRTQGLEALERCRVLGLPDGAIVFFSVDYDPDGETIKGPVCDFFRGVNEVIGSAITCNYRVGIYGTRNACSTVIGAELAAAAFVAGMSTGFSGNMGFPMPDEWSYNQIIETHEVFGYTSIPVDHVVVSSRAQAVDLGAVIGPPAEFDGSSTATGYDVAFEWMVRAEVACERALAEPTDILGSNHKEYSGFIREWVAHYLRYERYFEGGGLAALMWQTYTPMPLVDPKYAAALALCRGRMLGMAPSFPASNRDIAHWAATFLGYSKWGTEEPRDRVGKGDLGGFPLDLLQQWGVYDKLPEKPELSGWFEARVGSGDGAFGYKDLIADCDAYLIAKEAARQKGRLSDAARIIWRNPPATRVKWFYEQRFGASAENCSAAFENFCNSSLVFGDMEIVSNYFLKEASNASRMPNAAEARKIGQGFGGALQRIGGA